MLVAVIPLIVALVGLLMYILATNGKVQELGRLMFFAGILVTLSGVGNKSWHLGALEAPTPAIVASLPA